MLFTNANSPAFLTLIFVYSTLSRSGGGLSGTFLQYGSTLPLRSPPSDLLPLPREPAPPPLPPPPTKVSDYYGPHLVSVTVDHDFPSPATVILSPSATTGTTLPSPVLLPVILVPLSIFGIGVAYVRLFVGKRSSQQCTSFGITVSVPSYLSRQFAIVSKFIVHAIMMFCFVYGALQIVSDVTGQPSPSTLLRIVVSKLSLGIDRVSHMKIAVHLADLKQSVSSVDELCKLFATATDSVSLAFPPWYQHRIVSRGVFTLSMVKVVGGRLEFATLDMSDVLVLGRVSCGACCLIAFVSIIVFVSKVIVTSVLTQATRYLPALPEMFRSHGLASSRVLRNISLLLSSIKLNFVVPFIVHGIDLLDAAITAATPIIACRQLFSIPLAGNLLSALSLAIFVMECAFAAFKDECESYYVRLYRRLLQSVAWVRANRIVDTSVFPASSDSIKYSYTETSEDDSVFNTVPVCLDVISPKKTLNLRINTGFVFTPSRKDSDSTGSPGIPMSPATSSYFDSSSATLSGESTPATSVSDSSLLLPTVKEDEPVLPVATSAHCEEDIEQPTEYTDTPTSATDTSPSISAPMINELDLQAPITGMSQRQETQTEERHVLSSASAPLIAPVEDDGNGPWTVVEPKRCKRRYRAKLSPVDHSVGERLPPAPQRTPPAPPTVSSSNSSEESSVSTLMREFSKLSL
ncbi:hypothetical protein BD410DRAFT_901489 [Rickenella mellea]|uniref:CSC1/OSCA1-like 7TM region domain-containing protein n=1 Tax=Rickenella mellea TaxID=50990 RepID=A0A4Y7PPN9_9AGAM|nr:hypothetical protein BD410DRAFT_901489 [Rickenella mellea]